MWLFIINNLVKGFIPLCVFIWSIFMPTAGGWTFVGLYVAFQAYLFMIDSSKPTPNPAEWSPDEIAILRKYHLALRFSFGSKDMSCHLNGFRWIGLLFMTPLLLWHHMWIPAAIVVVSFVITGSISVRLDPFFFLGDAVNRGQMQFAPELELLKQVSDRLNEQARERASAQQSAAPLPSAPQTGPSEGAR
jgi:hypothetical protein